MFVSTLPYRAELDSCASFEKLVEQVGNRCLSILEHSHYPLQHILSDAQQQQSTAVFLETVFDFLTVSSTHDRLTLRDAELEPIALQPKDQVAKFDFHLSFVQDQSAVNSSLSCSFVCSHDLFDQATADTIANRFSVFMQQLFNVPMEQIREQPIYNLSIILPDELNLIRGLNQSVNIDNEHRGDTIGYLFTRQAIDHPQKIAVELDDQSLTYSELLYYVQQLALHLLVKYNVKPGEIICQCVERSLSMVSSREGDLCSNADFL
jgi:non-ribosomal peptide synthetase component F